ncbi:hypothetical protein [Tuwongella immobilis]|uniref:Uncharacterized protein n=1 Tax=Tuwongella immobilis TaxID=692036 RepID=A0A6C2YRZ8_9BACT|nr:hypothetical protein [Tuwongella immobilis]VIP03903.1 Uncharacterized protein OS=Planctomyces brasiliensis (strain ATCC 49424 / DSM 5305 / JCM 21570 / NBRC 103401 / IFAM 1448) GN=Plabr_0271 PE=4 SV=1 [Tuwongella immobilis]VTS05173.1 Uncharacterized protein OS=Planctomyces brasiliensis (strain ATCC 49424 / DSM 5305 / JCM 21570 / NBRC 103401 / IFAM 1448) GN=Plabr_0271 PE=4 SV=1 [Tuwongella immobilis]
MIERTSAPLILAVRLLSFEANEQLRELSRLEHPVGIDELALQFDDQAILVDQLVAAGQVSEEQQAIVRQIDELLRDMSGEVNAALWTPDSLRTSPLWANVRQLAKAFLDLTS